MSKAKRITKSKSINWKPSKTGSLYISIRPTVTRLSALVLGLSLVSTVASGCVSSSQKQGSSLPPTQESAIWGPKANAIRSAKQYLSVMGFSRDGLINQLSSEAGDGYDISDATYAVDSLNNDWDNEAARSAKNYLSTMGFSCKSLIEQLSSSAGDKYTLSQATFGARQAGACS